MPQLPSNSLLGLGGQSAPTDRGGARPLGGGVGSTGRSPAPVARIAAGAAAQPAGAGAHAGDFLHALINQLHGQLDSDPDVPAAAAQLSQDLPAGGEASPQALPVDPVDPDSRAAAATTDAATLAGAMPLPVQPLAPTEVIVAAAMNTTPTSIDGETSGEARDDAIGGRAAPRGLLAMLEQRADNTTHSEQMPALRTSPAALTPAPNMASDTATLLASTAASAREASFARALATHAAAEPAPNTPSTPSALLVSTPSETARAPVPAFQIEQPVAQGAWKDAVGHQVTWMVANQVSRAELRLHPAHLGPIDVSVTVHNDKVSVSFQASHPATREALESSLPRLRELLGDSGLTLGQASVSQQFTGGERTPERTAPERSSGTSHVADAAAVHETTVTPRARVGLLDAYA